MVFEIVKRHGESYVGLAIPDGQPGLRTAGRELVDFTVERIRERGSSEVFVVYAVSPPPRTCSVVIGYPCDSIDQLEVGDVYVRVPTGYFAHFRSDERTEGDSLVEVWSQVAVATDRGQIQRAFTEDIEVRRPGSVELYISLA